MIESHIRLFLLKAGMTTKWSCFIHGSWIFFMWSAISGVTVCQLTFFSRESSSSVDVVFSTVQYESEDTLFISKRWKILLPGFLCLLKNSNVLGVSLISKTLHCWFFYVATTPSLRFFGLSLFSRGLHRHSWHRCRHLHPSNCLMYHIWMKMGILTSSLPMACLRIMVFHRLQDPSHLLCVFMDLLWLPPLQCIRHCLYFLVPASYKASWSLLRSLLFKHFILRAIDLHQVSNRRHFGLNVSTSNSYRMVLGPTGIGLLAVTATRK